MPVATLREAGVPVEEGSSKGRVLVVEDEPVPRRLLVLSLERIGFEVIACDDGPSALDAARAEMPDAVVLDIRLPKMHGWDVLAGLREDPITADIPVLVVTAYEGAESQRLATVTPPDASWPSLTMSTACDAKLWLWSRSLTLAEKSAEAAATLRRALQVDTTGVGGFPFVQPDVAAHLGGTQKNQEGDGGQGPDQPASEPDQRNRNCAPEAPLSLDP